MEAIVATVLAQEILEKFSSDNLEELKEAVAKHQGVYKSIGSSYGKKPSISQD